MAQQRTSRTARIESQMQRALAALLMRGVKDPRVGNVTVTAVSVQKDLSAARVWFLPFGKVADPAAQLEGLASAAGFLRGEVARQLGLRHAPKLEFILDTGLEQAVHLTQLIDRAVASDRAHVPAAEGGTGADSAPGQEPDPDDAS
jgi:ribosome-binding factor A